MLAPKDKEIRFIHEAKATLPEVTPKEDLIKVWQSFFQADRWFRLSDLELSLWMPSLRQWVKSGSGEFLMEIALSPGSDTKIFSRKTNVHLTRTGELTLEEFTGYTIDASGGKPTVLLFDKTLFDRLTYFGSMAVQLLGDGFGAQEIDSKSTLILSDISDHDKVLRFYNSEGAEKTLRLNKGKAIFTGQYKVGEVKMAAKNASPKEELDLGLDFKLED